MANENYKLRNTKITVFTQKKNTTALQRHENVTIQLQSSFFYTLTFITEAAFFEKRLFRYLDWRFKRVQKNVPLMEEEREREGCVCEREGEWKMVEKARTHTHELFSYNIFTRSVNYNKHQ